jgi:ribose/xylose/arabinose/galactoside ABC-type transport system permease subunit
MQLGRHQHEINQTLREENMPEKAVKKKIEEVREIIPGEEKPAYQAEGFINKTWIFLKTNPAILMLVALVIFGRFTSPVFFTQQNILNLIWIVSVLGILSLGQTLLLITGNFDMSVAYIIGLAGIATVLAQRAGADLFLSILVGLAAGALVGLVNGILVVKTKANAFLITLGTSFLVFSISLTITHSKTFYATIPEFSLLGSLKVFGVLHFSTVIFLLLALILEFVLRKTVFGRSLYVIGLNQKAGELSGIKSNRNKLIAYILCGALAALAGLVIVSRNGSTVANSGVGMEFQSLIASVLGGTSLHGGKGGTLRTVIGVLIFGVLNNLLILLNVPIEAQEVATGLVFIIVVWADGAFQKVRG